MPRSKRKTLRRDPLPERFESLEDFWEFWDTHSTADYADQMSAVRAVVKIQSRKIYYPVAQELASGLQQEARRQGITAETLVNLWLKEKLSLSRAS